MRSQRRGSFAFLRASRQPGFAGWLICLVLIAGCAQQAPVPAGNTQVPRSAASESPAAPNASKAGVSTPAATGSRGVSPAIGTAEQPIIVGMYSYFADIPELLAQEQQWLAALSAASGLAFVLDSGLVGEAETIEALAGGRIHMAELSALGFNIVQTQSQVWPAAMTHYENQMHSRIMFIARSDSGLAPGQTPDVLRQLQGRRPCWPEQRADQRTELQPLAEYLLPSGLLADHGVTTSPPVVLKRTPTSGSVEAGVFRGKCDFAVVSAVSPQNYKQQLPRELRGVGFERWAAEMQILYTTPPLIPGSVIVLSRELPDQLRGRIQRAVIATQRFGEPIRYTDVDEALLAEFAGVVASSGVDVSQYLWRLPSNRQ